jgi:hypothetical protein
MPTEEVIDLLDQILFREIEEPGHLLAYRSAYPQQTNLVPDEGVKEVLVEGLDARWQLKFWIESHGLVPSLFAEDSIFDFLSGLIVIGIDHMAPDTIFPIIIGRSIAVWDAQADGEPLGQTIIEDLLNSLEPADLFFFRLCRHGSLH